jgi:hypothetical protein
VRESKESSEVSTNDPVNLVNPVEDEVKDEDPKKSREEGNI